MIQGKQLLFIIIVLVVVGVGVIFAYGAGIEKGKQDEGKKLDEMLTKFTLLPRLDPIASWKATIVGIVETISQQSITLESGGEIFEFVFTEDTKVERNLVKKGITTSTVTGLGVDDIKQGETVNIVVSANSQGDLIVHKIIIFASQQ